MNSKFFSTFKMNLHGRFLHSSALLLLIFFLFAITSQVTAQQPDSLWTKILGGPDYDRAHSMIQTADGGFALIGEIDGFMEFGTRRKGKIWLVKTNSSGDTLWTKTFVGSEYDLGNAVRQTSDGGYILAGYTSVGAFSAVDAWIIRTDTAGDTLWTRTYGTNSEESANDVIETADGGFVFTGFAASGTSTRERDAWLVKIDSAGDTLWTGRYYSGDVENVGNRVLETDDGDFIVAGTTKVRGQVEDVFLFRTDKNGNELWSKTYNKTDGSKNEVDKGRDIVELDDDGFMVLGFSRFSTWLLRTDAIGDTLWTKKLTVNGESIKQTSDGGFIITGGTGLERINIAGDTLWTLNELGGLSNSVEQTSEGGFVVSGYYLNYDNNRLEDLWIFKLGPEGSATSNRTNYENPMVAKLHQNYPNPFNPATIIPYFLPATAHVKVEIYDMLGRRLVTLIDGMMQGGSHQVQFDAGHLSSGIYLVRLEAGSFTASRKLTLMK